MQRGNYEKKRITTTQIREEKCEKERKVTMQRGE
jgi:hypothetical protein